MPHIFLFLLIIVVGILCGCYENFPKTTIFILSVIGFRLFLFNAFFKYVINPWSARIMRDWMRRAGAANAQKKMT